MPYLLIVSDPPGREIGQRGHRVIADRRQADAGFAKVGKTALQLHELRFAIRSPVCRAEEDNDRAIRTEQRSQRPLLTALIAEAELGQRITDLWAHSLDIDRRGGRVRLLASGEAEGRGESQQAEAKSDAKALECAGHAKPSPFDVGTSPTRCGCAVRHIILRLRQTSQ
jgi:hypothetical protein